MDGLWILIGMMGSGKSAIGRRLAADLQLPFLDTDTMLQSRFGRPVAEIFAVYGEDAFRGHETNILRGLTREPGILSTGGGIVMRNDNWTEMRRLGQTVFLDVAPDVLTDRLERSAKKRPLLMVENWRDRFTEIYQSRLNLYEQCDFRVQLGDLSIEDAANQVLECIGVAPSS